MCIEGFIYKYINNKINIKILLNSKFFYVGLHSERLNANRGLFAP